MTDTILAIILFELDIIQASSSCINNIIVLEII